MLLIGLAAGGWMFFPQGARADGKDTIVLADFTNTTGDPVFDGTLRQGLSVQLEQSPFLSIISDQQIQQTLSRWVSRRCKTHAGDCAGTLPADGERRRARRFDRADWHAVSSDAQGGQLREREYRWRARRPRRATKNHVLEALGKIAVELRNKLGESLSTVQKFDTPLEQATTPSLEALKALSSGIQTISTKGSDAAIPFFKHAIELDPNFALAYAYLGTVENDIGESGLAVENHRKAYELRERTTEAERYSIMAAYHKDVTGDIEKAIETCRLWMQAYPRSPFPHNHLAGMIFPVIGEYEELVEEGNEAIRLNPDFRFPTSILGGGYIALGRLDEAKAAFAASSRTETGYSSFLDRPLSNCISTERCGRNGTAGHEDCRCGRDRGRDIGTGSRYGCLFRTS